MELSGSGRLVQVMLTIWDEIQEVKNGEADKTDNIEEFDIRNYV